MKPSCITCTHLPGCNILREKGRPFIEERVVYTHDNRLCDDHEEMSQDEAWVRQRMFAMTKSESHVVRSIYQRGSPSLEEEEQQEEDDVNEDVPDFAEMLYDGISVEEREQQLRYRTDENGHVTTDEDGRKVPIGSFPLRQYAADPAGTVGTDKRKIMFWPTDKLVIHILEKEYDQGLLTRGGKTKRKKTAPKKKKTPAKKAPAKKEGKATMGTIKINRTKKAAGGDEAPAKKGPATSKKTPSKKKTTKKAPSKAKAAETEAPSGEGISAKQYEEMMTEMGRIRKDIGTCLKQQKELLDLVPLAATLVHDPGMQKFNKFITQLTQCEGPVDWTPLWECVPLTEPDDDGDQSPVIDGENLMAKEGGEHTVMIYLDQDYSQGEEEAGDEE